MPGQSACPRFPLRKSETSIRGVAQILDLVLNTQLSVRNILTADYNFDSELTTAESAAHRAGDAVMGLFKGKYDVHEKSKNNPVTTADLEANRIIRETISRAFPGDGWLSEEDQDSSRRLGLSRVWVVDPIDGTREFIDGIPQFAISIAFVVAGVPKVSVVFNPAENQFYKASVGRGAFLRHRAWLLQGVSVADQVPASRAYP